MRIRMGNDEFILYIRKTKLGCAKSNEQLGKEIWIWLRDQANGTKTVEDQPCVWEFGQHGLPKTAAQFVFDRAQLPELFTFLDSL